MQIEYKTWILMIAWIRHEDWDWFNFWNDFCPVDGVYCWRLQIAKFVIYFKNDPFDHKSFYIWGPT